MDGAGRCWAWAPLIVLDPHQALHALAIGCVALSPKHGDYLSAAAERVRGVECVNPLHQFQIVLQFTYPSGLARTRSSG